MKLSLPTALCLAAVCGACLPAPSALAQGGSSRYTITTIADNTAANSPFSTFSDAFPAINDNGVVVFRATLTDGSQLLYSSVNGTLTPLLSSTNTAGQFTGFLDMSAEINNQGTIVFAGGVSDGSPGIFTISQGGGAPVLVVDGASDPADFGGTIGSPAINDDGTIVFHGLGTEDPNTGIHLGGYYELPSGGAPVTLYSSGNNGSLYPPTINASGQVAFIIDPGVPEFSGETDPGQQVWRIDSPGAAPDVLAATGSQYSYFVDENDLVDIDTAGTVVFSATNMDGSQGIYLATNAGTTNTLVTTSSTGFTKLENVAFGKSDSVVFYGLTAAGAGGTFDGTDPVADQIFFDPYRGGNFTALSGIGHNQINSSGQLVFTYELDNGIKGIAVATPNAAAPPVPAPAPITSVNAASVDAGQQFSYQIQSKYATSYAVTGLPAGLSVNASTGLISGKPKVSGKFAVQLQAANASGNVSAQLLLNVVPLVSLKINVPTATEDTHARGEFTLILSAADNEEVTVHYQITGDAIDGTDYKKLMKTVQFKPGELKQHIYIVPKGDLEGMAEKTVKIKLAPNPSYSIETKTAVKVKIVAGG